MASSDESKSPMPYQLLGRSGLAVSRLSFGSWLTLGSKGIVDDVDNAAKLMQRAYDAGINFFDTAEVYAAGESERIMGGALKKLDWPRSSYVLSTKIFWGGAGVNQRGLSRKHIVEGTKASLERLGVENVDIIFAHRYDPLTPMEEIVRSFNFVIEQGWAYYWATSEWTGSQIAQAVETANRLGLIAPIADQCEYSMLTRDNVERNYEQVFKEYNYGTTIWSPLASGLLTGKYLGATPSDSRFGAANSGKVGKFGWQKKWEEEGNDGALHKSIRGVKEIADELGVSMAQLAIAWCLKNDKVSTVILGATKLSQLEDNLGSLAVVEKLTPEIMEKLDKALGNKPVPIPKMRALP